MCNIVHRVIFDLLYDCIFLFPAGQPTSMWSRCTAADWGGTNHRLGSVNIKSVLMWWTLSDSASIDYSMSFYSSFFTYERVRFLRLCLFESISNCLYKRDVHVPEYELCFWKDKSYTVFFIITDWKILMISGWLTDICMVLKVFIVINRNMLFYCYCSSRFLLQYVLYKGLLTKISC